MGLGSPHPFRQGPEYAPGDGIEVLDIVQESGDPGLVPGISFLLVYGHRDGGSDSFTPIGLPRGGRDGSIGFATP